MPDPSFNGTNIFGPCPVITHIEPPNSRQYNAYPGVDGVESIDLGARLSYSEARGLLCADTAIALGAVEIAIIAIKRTDSFGTLVDTLGRTWADSILETFEVSQEVKFAPGFGWCRAYLMRFVHLGTVAPTAGS